MKRENSVDQISQEGFVFKIFKPLNGKKQDEISDPSVFDVPNFNEVISGFTVEASTFLISNSSRLINARVKIVYRYMILIITIFYVFFFFSSSNCLQNKSVVFVGQEICLHLSNNQNNKQFRQ